MRLVRHLKGAKNDSHRGAIEIGWLRTLCAAPSGIGAHSAGLKMVEGQGFEPWERY